MVAEVKILKPTSFESLELGNLK